MRKAGQTLGKIATNLVRRDSLPLGMSPTTLKSPTLPTPSQAHTLPEDPSRPTTRRASSGAANPNRNTSIQGSSREFSTSAVQSGLLSAFTSKPTQEQEAYAVLKKHVSETYLEAQYDIMKNHPDFPFAREAGKPPSEEGLKVLIGWKSGGLDKKINDARTSGIHDEDMAKLEAMAAKTIDLMKEVKGTPVRNTVMDPERLAQYEAGTEHTLKPLEGYTDISTGKEPRASGNVMIHFIPKEGRGTVSLNWGGQFAAEHELVPGSGRKVVVAENKERTEYLDKVADEAKELPLRTLVLQEV